MSQTSLQCPECGAQKLSVAVTGTGNLQVDFAKPEAESVLQKDVRYTWDAQGDCGCLSCGWKGKVEDSCIVTAYSLIRDLLGFVKGITPERPELNAYRVKLVKRVEEKMKDHAETLRKPFPALAGKAED